MKTITLAVGLMVLLALSSYALASDGAGEPDTQIVISPDKLMIEFVNFDVVADPIPFTILFDREQGSDSTLEGEITATIGYAYHVGINCKSMEDGECVKLSPGKYTVTAEAAGISEVGSITVPSNKP